MKSLKTKTENDKKYAGSICNLVNPYIKKAGSDYSQEQMLILKDKQHICWNALNYIIDSGNILN